jgi:tRNA U34 2-thiouridine synthase MnmA/TrmU
MAVKALALFSGGLDSILAAKIMMDQGVQVIGINFITEFLSSDIGGFKERIKES